jgi:L-lactate dehydrogenase
MIAHPTRVAVVGVGNVGASFAYALLLSGLAAEIVLIDQNRERAEGEAMDLNHIILVAANPVDVLTHTALRFSGLPPSRVIGSGTTLDTARFRFLISRHFGVDARSVHAYIIGEHGDGEVPVWSLANIAGMRLPEYCAANGVVLDDTTRQALYEQTRDAAYEIIQRKGATYYAIGAGLVRIVEAILRNQRTVLTVSSLIDGYYGLSDVAFSLPTVIDRDGIEQVIRLQLADDEEAALRRSADLLREHIQSIAKAA